MGKNLDAIAALFAAITDRKPPSTRYAPDENYAAFWESHQANAETLAAQRKAELDFMPKFLIKLLSPGDEAQTARTHASLLAQSYANWAFAGSLEQAFDFVLFLEGALLFDENDPRYRGAALDALACIAKKCPRFEINTGAISRGWRSAPYPAPFLLKELHALGCHIVLASDSHSAQTLCSGFPAAASLAAACGFTEADVWTDSGFSTIPLG